MFASAKWELRVPDSNEPSYDKYGELQSLDFEIATVSVGMESPGNSGHPALKPTGYSKSGGPKSLDPPSPVWAMPHLAWVWNTRCLRHLDFSVRVCPASRTPNRRTRRVRRLWSRSGRTLHPACRILGAVRGRDLEQSLKEDGRFIGSEVGGGGDIAFVNGCGHGRSSSGDRVKRCVSHISQQPVASAPSLHWRRDFRRGHG